jgi:ATP-binding cassette subfamily B protein RaxB
MKGVTIFQLKNISEHMGFSAKVLRIDTNQFATLQLPCVIHWEMNHFMVLHKVSSNYIWVHDPARGSRRLSFIEIDKSFTGIVLELKPQENLKKLSKPVNKSAVITCSLVKKYGFDILKLVGISCLIQILYISGVTLVQRLIDSSANPSHELNFVLLQFVLSLLLVWELC